MIIHPLVALLFFWSAYKKKRWIDALLGIAFLTFGLELVYG